MDNYWLPLSGIPQGGTTLVYDDQAFWRGLLSGYSLPCTIVNPIKATVEVLPQEDGLLFRGNLVGRISLPCDRCSEDSIVELNEHFDSFEPFPPEPEERHGKKQDRHKSDATEAVADDLPDQEVVRLDKHGRSVEINPAALAWQEFSLALPIKPLCRENCAGLCPKCGCNKNVEQCGCPDSKSDPRLEKLRNMKIVKDS